jgi:hypothetical protein
VDLRLRLVDLHHVNTMLQWGHILGQDCLSLHHLKDLPRNHPNELQTLITLGQVRLLCCLLHLQA